ncbi:phage tail length tape measure family protein [Bradyrhizobium sp. ERR14]|uniref:phage tail length tape measure family protein n=1 Tax=Bradyrhizobium sp. ERR14 TaxID=2663837 RepID=UPI001615639B|nr:phage tail length tape measure family protein [Bradyrhizobium sp. ERR14]MBB4391825.1 hypothetical protein [Bradyrhizobium sp. ERR14]
MSTDIARLGLAIDSSPVTAASTALDKFQASANAAAAGADKLQAATRTTGANVVAISRSAETAAKGIDKVAASTGLARHEMINLSRQMQDVGVSLVSGQSPFMVLAQQGAQIADIFGSSKTGTVGGALRQIGSSIAGILTPMRLLGGGAALIATGFAVAANSIIKSTLALDDLSRSTDLSLTKIHGLQQATSAKGIGNDEFSKGITEFADSAYQAQRNFGSLNSLMNANGKSAKDLSGYLGSVADLVARATGDVQKQKILREAGLPSDAAWVRFMEQGSKGIQAAVDGSVKFNESAELNLIRKAREFDDAWNKATTNMVNYFKSGVVDITAALASIKVPDWLKTIGDKALSINPLTAGAYNLAKTAAGALSSDPNFADRFGSFDRPLNAGQMQRGLNQRAGIAEPKTGTERLIDIGKAQQTIGLLGSLATVEDQVKSKSLELDAAFIQNGVGVGKMRDAVLNAVRAQAELARVQEQASIGIFSFRDANKAAADTLQNWADRKLFDPSNIEQFSRAATLAAKTVEDLNDQAKVAGSLLPQFQQALNDAGNARKQLDSLMVEGMSVNRGFFVEFGQQLRAGATMWDAFKSAGLNALGKISDKLMQMAADKLFASAFGGSSGGFGLGSLFGGGSGSVGVMSAAGDLGAGTGGLSFPMFAGGGYTGNGGKFQPAGIVHKGEYVMDAVTVRRVGVANLDSLRGYADGGLVGHMNRAAGNSGPAVVMQDNRQISIGEGASQETVTQLREELARDRAARYADTVRIFHTAKKRREV